MSEEVFYKPGSLKIHITYPSPCALSPASSALSVVAASFASAGPFNVVVVVVVFFPRVRGDTCKWSSVAAAAPTCWCPVFSLRGRRVFSVGETDPSLSDSRPLFWPIWGFFPSLDGEMGVPVFFNFAKCWLKPSQYLARSQCAITGLRRLWVNKDKELDK